MKKVLKIFTALVLLISAFNFLSPDEKAAAEGQAVIGKTLQEKLRSSSGPINAVVTFKAKDWVQESAKNVLSHAGIQDAVLLQSLPMAGIVATKEQIEKLAEEPGVYSIFLNEKLTYYNADATEITGVDKARTDTAFTAANGGIPLTGKGIGVVVNDSGVDGTHKDHELGKNLVQNVMASTNLHSISGILPISYAENVPNTDTNSGHGTHVAGTVGGTGAMSRGKYEGAAPGADLIGYGSGAALFVLDGIGGFDYAITHQSKYNIRVITNSWGSTGDFEPEHPINIASKAAYDRGITVLFAAGNEGPGEDTHNPYAKAPWVISVAAGEKSGKLAEFSSRGKKNAGGTFNMDGKTWTWNDEPSLTAPGVNIVSTRVIAPVSSLGAVDDASGIEPAYLPYYTTMSGTSMATPHVAGIAALLLEANPRLSPDQIKNILRKTATNIPGMETWESGAGYVNAYAAIDNVLNGTEYGKTVNALRTFNSSASINEASSNFTLTYDPVKLTSENKHVFQVPTGVASLSAKVNGEGIDGETGNPINLVLVSPDGTEYSSGVSLLFPLEYTRTVVVDSPVAGEWKAEVRGLRGDENNPTSGVSLPEELKGSITFKTAGGFTGLKDIAGHPAEAAIQTAVSERLVDGYSDGTFKPNQLLTRIELARYLLSGAEIRQAVKASSLPDVPAADRPFAQAVTLRGGALRDGKQIQKGVMLLKTDGKFAPSGTVSRAELAYSFVQSLGLESLALSKAADPLTVQSGDERVKIDDAANVPAHLRGYVQVALDLNLLNAYFKVVQGPYDLEPVLHAEFRPSANILRGEYAVAANRFYQAFMQ
ncbi:S8 family serine peptidase [Fictibacillus aquaticus]|uniref:Peptidase S8 n=1 Tax=Fictibacillus aquaticus TaxID=2021314 RepID=A0A235FCN0_9BACL|nr:S8 family serine peptidase [Fictibacillus aquaticus]OYD59140.1 peptidase S8 [Fictibacillus aquaticus]